METKEKTKFIKGEYYIALIKDGVCIVRLDAIDEKHKRFTGKCVFSNDGLNKKGDTANNWDMTSFNQLTDK